EVDARSPHGASVSDAVVRTGPDPDELRAARQRLRELDHRLRQMAAGDVSAWDLETLGREYAALRKDAASSGIAAQIDMRFATIDRYRQIKADYDAVLAIKAETERRDAQLIAEWERQQQALAAAPPQPTVTPAAIPTAPSRATKAVQSAPAVAEPQFAPPLA
ncbi:MAG: hypothetical protein ACREJB_13050, partial [Planctomycetaceae bacterium]